MDGMSEHAPDAAFALKYPRAEKYIGWPMLAVMLLSVPSGDAKEDESW